MAKKMRGYETLATFSDHDRDLKRHQGFDFSFTRKFLQYVIG